MPRRSLANRLPSTRFSVTPSGGRSLGESLVLFLEIAVLVAAMEWILWTGHKRFWRDYAEIPIEWIAPVMTLGYLLSATIAGWLTWRSIGYFRQAWNELPIPSPLFTTFAGLAPTRWTGGLGSLSAFTLLATAAITLVGLVRGIESDWGQFSHWFLANAPLAILQHWCMQILVADRLRLCDEFSETLTTAVVAILFALLHAPNWPLALLTLPAGYYWLSWFGRYRNLPAVCVSHWILASAVFFFLNGDDLRNLRVGVGYLLFVDRGG